MKYMLLFACIGCMPGTLHAQQTTGGYQCGATFGVSIVYDHNSGVPITAPYVMYKDSSYTAVFHFEGTGSSWTTGGGIIDAWFDSAHSTNSFTGFGYFNVHIPANGFDTGHHTVYLTLNSTDMECPGFNFGKVYKVDVMVDTTKPPVPPLVEPYQPPRHYTDAELMPYPNPTSDSLHFVLDSGEIYWQLDVYDVAGVKPLSHFRGFTNHVAIAIGDLAPGIYYVSLFTNKRRLKTRFEKEW